MNKVILFGLCLFLTASSVAEQTQPQENFVHTNSEYSYHMLDPTTDIVNKQLFLFNNKDKYLKEGALYLGVSFIGLADYQKSNKDSKFGWLMRHPTSANQVGKRVSEVVVHSVQVQASGSLNSFMTLFSEFLYNPQQSFGAGATITGLARNQVSVRRTYLLIGDKKKSPFYMSHGKQDVPFGLMDTVSPFTASTTWHAFGPLAYSTIFGADYKGINVAVTAIQGGAQFRAANVPVRGTAVPSSVKNFSANISGTYTFCRSSSLKVGGSYIRGSAYNQSFPVLHFNPGSDNNPAWDVYTQLRLKNFVLQGEFAKTKKIWPGTHNPNAPLNIFPASKVSSFAAGAAYTFRNLFSLSNLKISLEHSDFVAGAKGSPWRRQSQTVLGASSHLKKNAKVFGELIRIKGFAPLNGISGSTATATTTISDKGARITVFVVGIQATL